MITLVEEFNNYKQENPNLSDIAINTKIDEDRTVNDYRNQRAVEYAKRNQDEMRYDDIKNGTNTWVEWQDQIRIDIPKPTGET